MDVSGIADARTCWNWPPANDQSARVGKCHSLCSRDRLPMAGAAQRLSPPPAPARVLLSLARRRGFAMHQPPPPQAGPPDHRAETDAIGWHHREPEGENHGKGRSAWV